MIIKRITSKLRLANNRGLLHDSRNDVRELAKTCNLLIDKVNELTDKVNELEKERNK